MATSLTAKFSLIDEMSAKMTRMADAGKKMLDSWQSATDSVNSSMSKIDGTSKNAVRSVDGVARSVDSLESASSDAEGSLNELTIAETRAADAMEAVSESGVASAREIDTLEQEAGQAAQAVEDMGEKSSKAADGVEDLGDESEEAADKMDELEEEGVGALVAVGQALAAAGIVKGLKEIAEAFYEAALKAESFESSIAQLQTIAGSSQIDVLTADIKELSSRTGIASADLAEVAYNAISAGTAVDKAVSMAEASSKLAVAGFTDTSSALSVLTTAINAYGDAAGTASEISDSLITVQNLGVTTVAQLSATMGKAIATASAYNVSLDNLESAYISTTKAGINTMESTTYLSSMLKELGSSSTEVAKIIQEQTGQSFGQLMASGASLGDVLQILYENANEDAEALMNLWGSAEAGKAANALLSQGLDAFNDNLEAIRTSAGATEEAYAIMADTTEYAHNRMTNSVENLGIAFGEMLNPAMETGYNLITDITTGLTSFVQEHPVVAKAFTAVAVGIGVSTVALVALGVATSEFGKKFMVTMAQVYASMGPIGWVTAGITALVTAVTSFILMAGDMSSEYDKLTATSKDNYDAMMEANDAYEAAVRDYGELSEEASRARYRLDELTEAYERNKKTLEDLQEEIKNAADAYYDSRHTFEDNMSSIDDEEAKLFSLTQKLSDLASSSGDSAASQEVMKNIIDTLNGSVEGLNLSYADLLIHHDTAIAKTKEAVKAYAEEQRQLEKVNRLVELWGMEDADDGPVRAYTDALNEQNAAWERLGTGYANAEEMHDAAVAAMEIDELGNVIGSTGALYDSYMHAVFAMSAYDQAVRDATPAYEDYINEVETLEGELGFTADSLSDTEEAVISYEDAATAAFSNIEERVKTLTDAYAKAYETAKESFEGQFSLFDQASTKSETYMQATVANAQAALESQLNYWTEYSSNINQLKDISATDLGMTQENYEALMSYVQSGSEEAAGLAASMVDSIKDGDLTALQDLGNTFTKVQETKDQAAETVADWQTGFSKQMEEISKEMAQTVEDIVQGVEDMDISDEAYDAAFNTMKAYVDEISRQGDIAATTAQSIANRVSAALSSANGTIKIGTSYSGHANGTTNAEDAFIAGEEGTELVATADAYANGTTNAKGKFFIAGEEGPELIVGKQGSTVFPHSETEKIIQSITEPPAIYENEIPNEVLNAILGLYTMFTSQFTGEDEKASVWSNSAGFEGVGDDETLAQTMDIKPIEVEDTSKHETNETNGSSGKPAEESKRIYLEIDGSGSIDVSARTNVDDVVDIIQDHLKPIIYGIIQQDMFEQGDRTYAY